MAPNKKREDYIKRFEDRQAALLERVRDQFPQVGDKVIFTGVPKFYYPHFIDMGDRARRRLVLNQEYTVTKVEIYSSWCSVEVEGVEGYYNRMFFKNVESTQ